MQLAIKVKLIPSQEREKILLETIEAFNEACNFVSQIAFENKTASVVKIHHTCYYEIRKKFNLSSQMAVRVVGKVADAYKIARNKKLRLEKPHRFSKHGAIVYDQRVLTWKGLEKVSILTLRGRQVVPIVLGGYQETKLQFPRRGQVNLLYKNGKFCLVAIVDVPEPPEKVNKEFLGIDMGVKVLATDSEGEFYSGKEVDKKRVKIDTLKSALQKCGSKSAQRCSNCGYIAKHNRKNQSNFVCRSCDFSANADHNGAINIAQLAAANLRIVTSQGSYKPLSL